MNISAYPHTCNIRRVGSDLREMPVITRIPVGEMANSDLIAPVRPIKRLNIRQLARALRVAGIPPFFLSAFLPLLSPVINRRFERGPLPPSTSPLPNYRF